MREPCVYLITNRSDGVLYLGVTSNLSRRVDEHRSGAVEGFSRRYKLHRLVWFELHDSMISAIEREKQIKKWRREWKVALILEKNPEWRDLSDELTW
jgi:putative endonuclease